MEVQKRDFDFSIRYNNAAVRGTCPITGEPFKPEIGTALFLDIQGEPLPVSYEAGVKYAPELMKLIEHFFDNNVLESVMTEGA